MKSWRISCRKNSSCGRSSSTSSTADSMNAVAFAANGTKYATSSQRNSASVHASIAASSRTCFPNAVSLKFDAGVFLTYDSVENHLLPCLSKLNRIARHEFRTKEWPLVHFQPNCLATFNAVRSLSVTGRDESAFFDFLETLRCLTGLTELELRTEAIYINATDLAPITEIKELRTLKASSRFIVDRNDDFIFGTQQQLTKLEVRHEFFSASRSTTLQVMPVLLFHFLDCISF